jgi:hypothetical protein
MTMPDLFQPENHSGWQRMLSCLFPQAIAPDPNAGKPDRLPDHLQAYH